MNDCKETLTLIEIAYDIYRTIFPLIRIQDLLYLFITSYTCITFYRISSNYIRIVKLKLSTSIALTILNILNLPLTITNYCCYSSLVP